MSLREKLTSHLRQFHTAPFLFVGSGLSRRYLGLEDWEGLLKRFAALTDRSYEYYRASADGVVPGIASELAQVFHPLWWADPRFNESRTKYAAEAKTKESALKIEIARYLEGVGVPQSGDPILAQELDLLRRATIDGVITTNWDLLLEFIFAGFDVYVGQDELLFAASHGVGEIYKIHGCCSKPNSLVATSEDYRRFNERNPYLAAKLLTVFAEHPIVFLGYSLNDPNVSSILQSIALCLTSENISQLRDRLILVRWNADEPDYRWEDNTIVVQNSPIPVKTVTTSSFVPVFEALAATPRKFPARVLRRLKEHVYDLVQDNDPAGKLRVVNIEEDDDMSKVDVVYGVGLQVSETKVRFSEEPDATPVRLTDDPSAPVLPFQPPLEDTPYATLQAELDAQVRTWRSDQLAYVARSRLGAFYTARLSLNLSRDALRCLLVSAMHQGMPMYYWASKLGRAALIPMIKQEIALDLHPRASCAARLAYAVGMSDGEAVLADIAKRSKYQTTRKLATRLLGQLGQSMAIHAEYRSPVRSVHVVDGKEMIVDITNLNEDPGLAENVISQLSRENDPEQRARLKQLDAYFYGGRI